MKMILLCLIITGSFSSFASMDLIGLSGQLEYSNYSEVESLSSDERWAVLAYGFTDETDYEDINGYLRHGDNYEFYNQTKESVTKLIKDIQSVANKLPEIAKGLVVFRGFKLKWRNDKCFIKGEEITDKAFISTTLNKKIAEHFAFKKGSGKGAFLTLKLRVSQRGILITENNEDEILLMPNRTIKITNSREVDGKCFAEGELK